MSDFTDAVEANARRTEMYRRERDEWKWKAKSRLAAVMEWERRAHNAERENAALREALRELLNNGGWGHSHWREGGSGGTCDTCETQRGACERARATLAPVPEPDTHGWRKPTERDLERGQEVADMLGIPAEPDSEEGA